MSKIRILATEDDPIHEEKLRMAMDQLNYDLVDVIADPRKVIPILSATKPDVLLMDIDLKSDISGIDLVNKINEMFDIPIVYLTSFNDTQTFKKARKTQPAAYITKPYKTDDLERSIELAVLTKQNVLTSSLSSKSTNVKNHLFIKDGQCLTKVMHSEITCIEAYDKYCYIHTNRKKFILKARLKNIADRLPGQLFLQVHRSFIINLDAIDEIRLTQNKIYIGGKEIGIGKTYKQTFLSKISTLG